MAQSDGAAIYVEFVAVKMQFAIAGEDLGREGFIEFDNIKIDQGELVFLLHLANRGDRANAHDARVDSR